MASLQLLLNKRGIARDAALQAPWLSLDAGGAMKPQVEAWLRQARDDLAMARLADEARFHTQARYHASQAAEKALKGLLIGLDLEPPRTHALERLVESLREAGVEV
ncbi:MAG: HEPN domain-containing protein [Synechococcaceae cyanobacterium ELA445]